MRRLLLLSAATAAQVQAGEGCQLANCVSRLLQAAAVQQVQAAKGGELSGSVRQLERALTAAFKVEAAEGCQLANVVCDWLFPPSLALQGRECCLRLQHSHAVEPCRLARWRLAVLHSSDGRLARSTLRRSVAQLELATGTTALSKPGTAQRPVYSSSSCGVFQPSFLSQVEPGCRAQLWRSDISAACAR
jgi:hypothetical protein